MALSGSFNTSKSSDYGHGTLGLHLAWTATQDIVNNTSKISWTLTSNGSMSKGNWYYCWGVEVKINGVKVLNTTSKFEMNGDGKYKKTGSITVAHNADGTKQVAMSVRAKIYQNSWNISGSSDPRLDTIDRYALITIAPNFTDEENPTVTFTNPLGADTVTDLKIRLSWNDENDATPYIDIPQEDWNGGTVTLDLTDYRNALRNATPSSNTLPVKFDLMSTMGGIQYNDKKDATMSIVNANPTPGIVTYQDINPDIVAITGSTPENPVVVQGKSTLRISTAASTGNKGASIVSYSLSFNGATYMPVGGNVDIIQPGITGTYRATVTTTDSRGNTAEAYADIYIYQYVKPKADAYKLERAIDFTTNDATLEVDGAISNIPGNSMLITETHREKDTGSWSTPDTVDDAVPKTIHSLDYQKEYEMKIEISDSFTRALSPLDTAIINTGIGKGIPIAFFDIKRHSVGVNGIPDSDEQFYVGGHIKAKPNETDDGVILPHSYSTNEQIVDYWIDGSPIYERTIELQSAVTVNANTWNNSVYTFDSAVMLLKAEAYNVANAAQTNYWGFMASQISADGLDLGLFNSRDSACLVNLVIVRYLKPNS